MEQSLINWTNVIVFAVIALAVIALLTWAGIAIAKRVQRPQNPGRRASGRTSGR